MKPSTDFHDRLYDMKFRLLQEDGTEVELKLISTSGPDHDETAYLSIEPFPE